MINVVIIFLGGGIGSSARYLLSNAVYRLTGSNFPYGTMAVNIIGCFLIGILITAFQDRFLVTPSLRMFLTIGILGGFTTFSTFSYETIMMLEDAEFLRAGLNVALTLVICLTATYAGLHFGKML